MDTLPNPRRVEATTAGPPRSYPRISGILRHTGFVGHASRIRRGPSRAPGHWPMSVLRQPAPRLLGATRLPALPWTRLAAAAHRRRSPAAQCVRAEPGQSQPGCLDFRLPFAALRPPAGATTWGASDPRCRQDAPEAGEGSGGDALRKTVPTLRWGRVARF